MADDNNNDYPSALDNLLERKLMFKIQVKTEHIIGKDKIFPVQKICEDGGIIDNFYPKDGCNDSAVNVAETNASNEVEGVGSVDLVEGGDSSVKSKTPNKRASVVSKTAQPISGENDEEGQLSANKFPRKGVKRQRSQLITGDD
ncbi:hypothetical protein PIB30_096260 [Stylosanthes scabra]|uniref:Uncharacterized protein n=1 Tax=Stylosanthes scabra TaxID=79078 RepID=A0ABU6YYT8_9FABA|nr:hypothetical protein [Stylosanthes scabra]